MVKIAVVGGGLFGTTAALELARSGHQVELFEARYDILSGATAKCQARLHSGYHYPRSDATAAAARDAAPKFKAAFPEAIKVAQHHYVIAQDSKVSANEYLAFCDRLGLPYKIVEPVQVHHAQLCVRVPEAFIDVDVLRRLLRRDLMLAKVITHLGQGTVEAPVRGYDLTIVATYGQPWSKPLRYEICEVAIVEVPRFRDQSFVVLDGNHVSLDPYGRMHMLYDVVHSVHDAVESLKPEIGNPYLNLLTRYGPVLAGVSKHEAMLQTASQHLQGLQPGGQGIALYHGSMFSVRAVLPDVDATDERPTLIDCDGRVISILSGKMCTALSTAESVAEMVSEMSQS